MAAADGRKWVPLDTRLTESRRLDKIADRAAVSFDRVVAVFVTWLALAGQESYNGRWPAGHVDVKYQRVADELRIPVDTVRKVTAAMIAAELLDVVAEDDTRPVLRLVDWDVWTASKRREQNRVRQESSRQRKAAEAEAARVAEARTVPF